jgi:hypothetical protein
MDATPVVLQIDQYNAFCEVPSSFSCSRIAKMIQNWNNNRMIRDGIFCAFASSFRIMPMVRDGNNRLILQLQPLDESTFKSLQKEQVSTGQLTEKFISHENTTCILIVPGFRANS